MARTKKSGTVVGVFTNRKSATEAVEALRAAGFKDSQIGFASRDRRKNVEEHETYAEEGAVTGVLVGGGIGALVGLGIVSGLIPAIGPFIAGGAIAAVLANAAGGAVIAGIAGALIGLGIPEEEAKFYEQELKSGRTIVTVKAGNRAEEARDILYRHGGYSMENAPATRTQAFARATAADELKEGRTVELKEERLNPRKTPVQTGEVKVRKDVVTERKTVDVPVRREEVVVERRPASGQRARAGSIRGGEEIRIPVREERVTVEKEPVVREEVRVGKRNVTDTQKVSGTVRREEARVERSGAAKVREQTESTGRR
jgi:uncharacterized protein (TIGR02271 family)